MILGALCRDGDPAQFKADILAAGSKLLHGRKDIKAKFWVGGRLAMCWIPRQIETFDECDQPSVSPDGTVTVMCEGKIAGLLDAAEATQEKVITYATHRGRQ